VRTADDRPVVFSRDVIPASVVGDKAEQLERMGQQSLYQIYSVQFGVAVTPGVASIRPVVLLPAVSRLILIEPDSPAVDALYAPVTLRVPAEEADYDLFHALRAWADSTLPDPRSAPYERPTSAVDLPRRSAADDRFVAWVAAECTIAPATDRRSVANSIVRRGAAKRSKHSSAPVLTDGCFWAKGGIYLNQAAWRHGRSTAGDVGDRRGSAGRRRPPVPGLAIRSR